MLCSFASSLLEVEENAKISLTLLSMSLWMSFFASVGLESVGGSGFVGSGCTAGSVLSLLLSPTFTAPTSALTACSSLGPSMSLS